MTRVEGENTRLRHYLARLYRKTLSYSKSVEMLKHSIRLGASHFRKNIARASLKLYAFVLLKDISSKVGCSPVLRRVVSVGLATVKPYLKYKLMSALYEPKFLIA